MTKRLIQQSDKTALVVKPKTTARHPTPDRPGHFWAKLTLPSGEPEGEDWRSADWEVVQVFDNNGEGDERWAVFVPGVPVAQWVLDFVWGPEVVMPEELGAK